MARASTASFPSAGDDVHENPTTTNKGPSLRVRGHHDATQTHQLGKSSMTCIDSGPRGTYSLEDDFQGVGDFAPYRHPPNELRRRVVSPHNDPRSSLQDEHTAEPSTEERSVFDAQIVPIPNVQVHESRPPLDLDPYHPGRSCYVGPQALPEPENEGAASCSLDPSFQDRNHETDIHVDECSSPGPLEHGLEEHDVDDTIVYGHQCDLSTPAVGTKIPSPNLGPSSATSISARSVSNSVLRPHVDDARVTKSISRSPTPQPRESNTMPISTRTPTEEDLLLLLMHRQRTRVQNYNQLLEDLHDTEAENQSLKNEGLKSKSLLESVTNRWQSVLLASKTREDELAQFTKKYDKLKIWAHDTQKAYEAARVEADRLSGEISKLQDDKVTHRQEINELLKDLGNESDSVQILKKTVAEMQENSVTVQADHQKQIKQVQHQVEMELEKNKALLCSFEGLAAGQQTLNLQFSNQHENLEKTWSKVSSEVQQSNASFVQNVVAEITTVIRDVQHNSSTKEEQSAWFCSLADAAKRNHAEMVKAMSEIGLLQVERHAAQTLRERTDQLEASYSAKLADVSANAAAKLKDAQNEIHALKDRFHNVQSEKEKLEKELASSDTTIKKKDDQLDAKSEKLEMIESDKQKLESEVQEQLSQLKSKAALLASCENRNAVLDQKHKAKEAENAILQKKLEHANVKATEASVLQAQVESMQVQMNTKSRQLDSARESAERVPDLLAKTEDLNALNRRLNTDVATIKARLAEQDQLISEVRNEKCNVDNAFEVLQSTHNQCESRDLDTANLKASIKKLIEEKKPLTELMNFLTAVEMGLDMDVVPTLQIVLQYAQNVGHSISKVVEGECTKPRRAANRDGHVNLHDVIVPDSQQEARVLQEEFDDTSELSEAPEESTELVNDDFDFITGTGSTANAFSSLLHHSQTVNDFATEDLRPATSNDEMLLRSSDNGSYFPGAQTQISLLAPGEQPEVSPMRTRQGSQIRHGTPRPRTGTDGERIVNFSTPAPYPREIHPPNSAVKRRQTSEAPETTAKRRNVNMKNLEVSRSSISTISTSTQTTDGDNTYGLPAGARTSAGIIGVKMPIPGKTKKKATNSMKKSSKSARMEAQFDGAV